MMHTVTVLPHNFICSVLTVLIFWRCSHKTASSFLPHAAGVEALAAHCGVKPDEITRVFLAGGLGYYMSPARAARTGLLPTALDALVKQIETVELSFSPIFSQAYIENMGF